ncbi:MAG: TrmH family RNA methyltransferase [bacterium]|nr:TrmH family RNA methyltransferase [bacterium]
MVKMNAAQLRKGTGDKRSLRPVGLRVRGTVKKQEIYIVLDNVLDTYNIGSIFRLADAVAAKKVYLCGGTEIPPNHRIKKASINTTEWVDWEYAETALQAVRKVKDLWNCHPEGAKRPKDINQELYSSLIAQNDRMGMVVAIEQSSKSVPYDKFDYKLPICLVVGHESNGVSKEVLEIVDGTVEIPMFGVNISLNVMVSLGIVLYEVISSTVIPSEA